MSVRGAIVAGALIVAGGPALAADFSEELFSPHPIYGQLLGGVALGNTVSYFDPGGVPQPSDATKVGYAIAGTLGVVVMDGLSVEADVLHTRRDENGGTSAFHTTSLMANLKYTAALHHMFSFYAAAGVGYVWYGVTDPLAGDNPTSGAGYQFILGVSARVANNFSMIAEARYQDTFNANRIPAVVDLRMPTTAVLAGVKIGL